MICPNCNTHHGCGCQAKTASDGKLCCTSCIQNYELRKTNQPTPSPNNFQGSPEPNLNTSMKPIFH